MKAALYTRESLDRTGEAAAVNRQHAAALQLAAERDIEVVYELSDNNVSATTGAKRPDFQKLLKLIERREVDAVIVWHPDRLYRKLRDLVPLMELAEDRPLMLLSVTFSDMDLGTASGRMIATNFASVGNYEGEHKSERQVSAYKDYAKQGRWHFSHRPFGYEREEGRLKPVTIVHAEAEELRHLYRRYYDEGKSHHALVTDLNNRGVLTAKGNRWTITQLREVLSNPHYAGYNVYNGEVIDAAQWEPIIARRDWLRYQSAGSKRKVLVSTFSTTATSLLSGIIRCELCGAQCYRKQRGSRDMGGGKVYEYVCSRGAHVSGTQKPIDALVRTAVLNALVLGPVGAVPSGEDQQGVPALMEQLEQLDARVESIMEAIGDGHSTYAKQKLTLEKIKAEKADLEARRDRVLASSAMAEVLHSVTVRVFEEGRASISNAADKLGQVEANFDAMPLEKQRELIRLLLTVTMGKGRGTGKVVVERRALAPV